MLRTTACPEKRDSVFPGALNTAQDALKALVRTAWTADQSLKTVERMALIGGQPYGLHSMSWEEPGGVTDALVGGNVRWIAGIVVSNDANLYCGHIPRIGSK